MRIVSGPGAGPTRIVSGRSSPTSTSLILAEGDRGERVYLCDADQFGKRHAFVERVGPLGVGSVGDGGNAGLSDEGVAVVDERLGTDRQVPAGHRPVRILERPDQR